MEWSPHRDGRSPGLWALVATHLPTPPALPSRRPRRCRAAIPTPRQQPPAVPDDVIAAVVLLREKLTTEGLDAGPLTLQTHLAHQGLPVPSTATIRRILHHHGLITPQPRKRPKSPYHRFAGDQPNECWQSDFTDWTLADGTAVEILNWLDDHSRYLLACTAYPRVTGPDVVASFTATATTYGLPGLHPDRQRSGLHLTIHPRPQRLRTTPGQPGHHPEKRPQIGRAHV